MNAMNKEDVSMASVVTGMLVTGVLFPVLCHSKETSALLNVVCMFSRFVFWGRTDKLGGGGGGGGGRRWLRERGRCA